MRGDPLLRRQLAERLRALSELGVTELRLHGTARPAGSAGRAAVEPGGTEESHGRGSTPGAAGGGDSRASSTRGGPEAKTRVEIVRAPIQDNLFAERVTVDATADPRSLLEVLRVEEIGECTRCKLSGGRKTIVFGSGNPRAELMFVGEGPGADEDEQGLPFVGRAGQLLTKMVESMVVHGSPLRRDEVYIANIIKCRPPGNRDPEPDEIAACEGFLFKQIAFIRPRLIIALGAFAARTLLRSKAPISALRGRFHEYRGTLLMPTFHPAYVLRNYTEETRRTVYGDLKMAAAEIDRARSGR